MVSDILALRWEAYNMNYGNWDVAIGRRFAWTVKILPAEEVNTNA